MDWKSAELPQKRLKEYPEVLFEVQKDSGGSCEVQYGIKGE
jgi:hypothetical protein